MKNSVRVAKRASRSPVRHQEDAYLYSSSRLHGPSRSFLLVISLYLSVPRHPTCPHPHSFTYRTRGMLQLDMALSWKPDHASKRVSRTTLTRNSPSTHLARALRRRSGQVMVEEEGELGRRPNIAENGPHSLWLRRPQA